MMNEPDPMIKEFLVESYENLDRLDRDLVALEQDPRDRARLGSVFRTIHSIKGLCGFFGFVKLESVTHVGENLLCRLRDGELLLNPEIATALLSLVDAVRGILARLEASGEEGDKEYGDLIATLTRLANGPSTPESAATSPAAAPPAAPAAPSPSEGAAPPLPEAKDVPPPPAPAAPTPAPVAKAKGPSGGKAKAPPPAKAKNPTSVQAKEATASPANASAPEPPPPAAPEPAAPAAAVSREPAAVPAKGPAPAPENNQAAATVSDSNVRVDVGLLDKLMNLVGELVLARNQILQYVPTHKDPGLLRTAQRLNLITSELQEGVMKTRMQPIGTVWNRFPRIVRDLAAQCGKQVRVEMEGQDTELDRTIIEAIKDPLTHIVRNSVDHGVESPQDRLAAGKPAEGRLHLRAFHEGGQVNIEITDDGAGIRPERVRAKAVARGLIDADRADRMGDAELTQLIFLPGFSTAEKVTNVSGRGVGMDVVKTNIEKIGGTVDLQTRPGEGTTLRIKIPLTLAIIPALIVTCGGDRYAIPQVSLLELVRLDRDAARGRVESFQGAPVYRLRGNLLPLVYLHQLLHIDPQPTGDSVTIVVLRADDKSFGLIVDGIYDTEEIVVKPLGKVLQQIALFAGATIMGDGRVALIVDVLGVAQESRVAISRDRTAAEKQAASEGEGKAEIQTMLLVGLGSERRLAIPLAQIARLEEIPARSVEWSDGQEVIRYREEILPLLRVYDMLGCIGEPPPASEDLQVIVVADGNRSAGLVVGSILDAVETEVTIRRGSRRAGLIGTAVIQNRVTDVVDVHALLEMAEPAGV